MTKYMSIELNLKRGDKSWNYFQIAYGFLLAISLSIIAVLDIKSIYKVILILVLAVFLFWLCFYNDWFRNKIVGIFTKSQEKVERH